MCIWDWSLALEYLKVLLAWPPIFGIILALFLSQHRAAIGRLLDRFTTLKALGVEVSAAQLALQEIEVAPSNVERGAPEFWEFSYLNFFFQPLTQKVLTWLQAFDTGVTRSIFDETFENVRGDERAAILAALDAHGMLFKEGDQIRLTDKGRRYASWPHRRSLKQPIVVEAVGQARGRGRAFGVSG